MHKVPQFQSVLLFLHRAAESLHYSSLRRGNGLRGKQWHCFMRIAMLHSHASANTRQRTKPTVIKITNQELQGSTKTSPHTGEMFSRDVYRPNGSSLVDVDWRPRPVVSPRCKLRVLMGNAGLLSRRKRRPRNFKQLDRSFRITVDILLG